MLQNRIKLVAQKSDMFMCIFTYQTVSYCFYSSFSQNRIQLYPTLIFFIIKTSRKGVFIY